MTKREKPKPPAHLSEAARTWYHEVTEEFELCPHELKLLKLAAEAFDEAEAAREQLSRDGLTVETKHGVKAHPCVGIRRDARIAFARLCRELDLGEETARESRPPSLRSNRPIRRRP